MDDEMMKLVDKVLYATPEMTELVMWWVSENTKAHNSYNVKSAIRELKGNKPNKRITKKYLKELYGIKTLCKVRNYEDGFMDALRYYGYFSEKSQNRIDKIFNKRLSETKSKTSKE